MSNEATKCGIFMEDMEGQCRFYPNIRANEKKKKKKKIIRRIKSPHLTDAELPRCDIMKRGGPVAAGMRIKSPSVCVCVCVRVCVCVCVCGMDGICSFCWASLSRHSGQKGGSKRAALELWINSNGPIRVPNQPNHSAPFGSYLTNTIIVYQSRYRRHCRRFWEV